MEPTGDLPDRPHAARWVAVTGALCVLVALVGGFAAGWVGKDRADGDAADRRLDCILDVLIEPPERADPTDRFVVWVPERLVMECDITPRRAEDIRD